jgi:hypothetical protein
MPDPPDAGVRSAKRISCPLTERLPDAGGRNRSGDKIGLSATLPSSLVRYPYDERTHLRRSARSAEFPEQQQDRGPLRVRRRWLRRRSGVLSSLVECVAGIAITPRGVANFVG